MLWPLTPGITSFNGTQAILGRLSTQSPPWQAQHASYYTSTMTSDCSTVDAQRAFQRFFLESSEADVVDSEGTDSSNDVVSQSSLMTSGWTSVLHTSATVATSY
mmetsp:Transcript_29092/g.39536  ORF Transcript_29092/g.39536 Transcript_29092/m.39536 type:complete len:104 (-) Transcript_29092:1288-1599(-)